MQNIENQKAKLRIDARNILQSLNLKLYSQKSIDSLLSLQIFKDAKNVLAYFPNQEYEIPFIFDLIKTNPEKKYFFPKIIKNNKMVFLQSTNFQTFKKNKFNIPEPIKNNQT